MIRIDGNQFVPGSMPPRFVKAVGEFTLPPKTVDAIRYFIDDQAWVTGESFLILGGALTGKTSTGLYLMRQVFKEAGISPTYWTEADFQADLRNLWRYENLVEKSPNDSPLWNEYTAWERDFWDLKEAPLLFLDDVGRASTPLQRYELESLLRRRRDAGFSTIVGADLAVWAYVPETVKGLFKECQQVTLREEVHAGR